MASRYIAEQYNTILHTVQLRKQTFVQASNLGKAAISRPNVRAMAPFRELLEKNGREISGVHYIHSLHFGMLCCGLVSFGPLFELWQAYHDDVIQWKHFPRYWPFERGIHRSTVNSSHKGQWRGPLMFSLICASIDGWVNNGEAGDLRRYRTHNDVTVMICPMASEATPYWLKSIAMA